VTHDSGGISDGNGRSGTVTAVARRRKGSLLGSSCFFGIATLSTLQVLGQAVPGAWLRSSVEGGDSHTGAWGMAALVC